MKMKSASFFLAVAVLVSGSAYGELSRARRQAMNLVSLGGGGIAQVNQNIGHGGSQSNTLTVGKRSVDDITQVNQNIGNGGSQSNSITIGKRSADGITQVNQNQGNGAKQQNQVHINLQRLRRQAINFAQLRGGINQVNQNIGNDGRQSNSLTIGKRSVGDIAQVNQNIGNVGSQSNSITIGKRSVDGDDQSLAVESNREKRDFQISQVSTGGSDDGQGGSQTSTININGCRYVQHGGMQNGGAQVNSAVVSEGDAPFVMVNGQRFSTTSCDNGGDQ